MLFNQPITGRGFGANSFGKEADQCKFVTGKGQNFFLGTRLTSRNSQIMSSAQNSSVSGTVHGIRKSGNTYLISSLTIGKQWKTKSAPNRNPSLRKSFAKRISKDRQTEATKALERQLDKERKATEDVCTLPRLELMIGAKRGNEGEKGGKGGKGEIRIDESQGI